MFLAIAPVRRVSLTQRDGDGVRANAHVAIGRRGDLAGRRLHRQVLAFLETELLERLRMHLHPRLPRDLRDRDPAAPAATACSRRARRRASATDTRARSTHRSRCAIAAGDAASRALCAAATSGAAGHRSALVSAAANADAPPGNFAMYQVR